jgi:ribonuclease HII
MFHWERKLLKDKEVKFVAGVDEAGRGPLAGPVVAAAVVLKPRAGVYYPCFSPKFEHKIADSKVLTPQQRERAFWEIMLKSWVGVGIVKEDLIDTHNIAMATRMAMEQAIKNLSQPPDHVLVDGYVRLNLEQAYTCIVKGDAKIFSIACASILAKVIRDKIMETYDLFFPDYAFRRHKGYGTQLHMRLLERYGPSPIHRKSFWPVSAWYSR